MSVYLKIGGVTVKPPQEFSVSPETIDADSSGRNASGNMVRNIITKKRRLECVWGPLSDAEVSAILNAIDKPSFSVTYPDPQTGMTTKNFYAGTPSAPSYSWNEKFSQVKWQGLSVNFIEM